MRILINYLYQYYPFTTATYYEAAFKRYPRASVFRVGQDRVPCADIIVNIEPCGEIVTYPTATTCYIEIDNHIHRGKDVEKYSQVDHVFVAQKGYLPLYDQTKTTWLPLAADPEKHKYYQDEPLIYDVGFLGNDTYPRRREFLDLIGKKYKLLRSTAQPGEEYSRKLSQCKMIFNCSMDNDVNMRFFEAMSIGRLLLSDRVDGQDELAQSGKHYVSYADWTGLDWRINHYLKHEEEREKIAKAGAALVHARHTYDDRVDTIMEILHKY